MSLFGRKTVPEWASLFAEKEHIAFIAALESYFRKTLNLAYEIHDGVVLPDKTNMDLGLLNLAQVCKHNKIREYPEIISGHFNAMIEAYKF